MGQAVEAFRRACLDKRLRGPVLGIPNGDLRKWLEPLVGRNLACWCRLFDENGNRIRCHADVLLELANK